MELYKIEQRIRDLLDTMDEYIDDETGEVKDGFTELVDSLDIEIKYKIESIGVVIRELKGDTETLKSELDRLKQRKASMERRAAWLVDYVSNTMRALGIEKHTSPNGLFTVYLQKNPDRIEVAYPDNLPMKYQRVPPVEAMVQDLKRDMDSGQVPDSVIKKAGITTLVGIKKVRFK